MLKWYLNLVIASVNGERYKSALVTDTPRAPMLTPPLCKIHPFAKPKSYIVVTFEPMIKLLNTFGLGGLGGYYYKKV